MLINSCVREDTAQVSRCVHVRSWLSCKSDWPGSWFIISAKDSSLLNDCITSADAAEATNKSYKCKRLCESQKIHGLAAKPLSDRQLRSTFASVTYVARELNFPPRKRTSSGDSVKQFYGHQEGTLHVAIAIMRIVITGADGMKPDLPNEGRVSSSLPTSAAPDRCPHHHRFWHRQVRGNFLKSTFASQTLQFPKSLVCVSWRLDGNNIRSSATWNNDIYHTESVQHG